MKYGLIVGLASILFNLPAVAGDSNWVYVGGGSISQVYIQNVEVGSDVNSGVAEAWAKSTYKDGSYVLEKRKYACSKNEYLKLESYKYDRNGDYLSGGKNESIWLSAIPESVGYLMLETVCIAAAKQEFDNLDLVEGDYNSKEGHLLIHDSFGDYAHAAAMMKIQESIDDIEW